MEMSPTSSWQPGLHNELLTLGEVLDSMPKDPPGAIPWYVRMLENPRSPVALPGAIDLFGHDCIHVLLGRGLLSQDEAFVIGYTMGTSQKLTTVQKEFYRWFSAHVYRGVFRFSPVDCAVFDLGVSVGQHGRSHALHTVDYRTLLKRPLGHLRAELEIPVNLLYEAYELERHMFPDSDVSRRLPRRPAANDLRTPGPTLLRPSTRSDQTKPNDRDRVQNQKHGPHGRTTSGKQRRA